MNTKERLWIYAHPTNSLHGTFKLYKESQITPVEAMKELGVEKAIYVPYKHEIDIEEDFRLLNENCTEFGFSIEDFADVDKCVELKKKYPKLTFALFDDFLNADNERNIDYFTVDGLRQIKKTLNDNGMSVWMVYYEKQIDIDIAPYLDLFDGVTFWFWKEPDEKFYEEIMERFIEKTPDKKRMVGVYLYNFKMREEAKDEMVLHQLNRNRELMEKGIINGIIIHNSAIFDMGFSAIETAKEWVRGLEDENTSLQ